MHVPAKEFGASDSLSRRRGADEDPEEETDYEDFIDNAYGFLLGGCQALREQEEWAPTVLIAEEYMLTGEEGVKRGESG